MMSHIHSSQQAMTAELENNSIHPEEELNE
jgi:hypothetical protein